MTKTKFMRKFLTFIMAFVVTASVAQQKKVTGTVTSKTTNAPLAGVAVQSKTGHAITDSSGKFSISVNEGDALAFSFVGMKPLSIKISASSDNLIVQLEELGGDLNVVVVTGYKSERKVDLTGAVSVVNLSTVKNSTLPSPMQALQGQVPGLYIQTDGSPTGGNGNPPTILVRGVNTLGNTNPLYIIDGVPTTRYEDFANISTGSISSIQVLKDASAASIYGSRASNGVIIVTTKNGATDNKTHIQFNTSITSQTEKPWQQDVLSSYDRGAALWRAAVNDSTDPNKLVDQIYRYDWNGDYANPVLNKVMIAPFVGATNNNQPNYDPFVGPYSATDSLEPVANTNWQDALYKPATVISS